MLAVIVITVGPNDRPAATWFLVLVALTAYETLFTYWFSGTPGKRWLRLRTVESDRPGRPSLNVCFRRGLVTVAFLAFAAIGWLLLLCSVLMSPLRRGFYDRAAQTIVVWSDVELPVRTELLPGFADAEQRPRMIPLGRVGDLEARRRARTRRLSGVPAPARRSHGAADRGPVHPGVHAGAAADHLGGLAGGVRHRRDPARAPRGSHGRSSPGRTRDPQHRHGWTPSVGRSFWRAVVLAFTLYVPPLWPVLSISLLRMKYSDAGRGLHDVAGGTVVVADPNLDPEEQRQRATSLRAGEVA